MSEERNIFKLIGFAAGIACAAVLVLDVGISTFEVIILGGISALSLVYGYDLEVTHLAVQEAESQGAFTDADEKFKSFDQIWAALQTWYGRDPRNGELVWQPGISAFDSTVPDSVDGKFRFLAILTPSKHTGKNVFCCVETKTMSLLTWDEKAEGVDRTSLFESVTLVEDLRRRKSVSADSVQNRIMANRAAHLGGSGYAQFLNGGQPSPDLEGLDEHSNNGDGGDEE